MMKNSLVLFKERGEIAYLYNLFFGLLFSMAIHPYTMVFVLLFSTFTYLKGVLPYFVFTISLAISCVLLNNSLGIIYVMFNLFVFICMKGYELLKLNAFVLMKYWNTAILLLTSYVMDENVNTALILGLSCFLLHHFFIQSYQKKESIKEILIFNFFSIIYFVLIQFNIPYHAIYTLIILCLIVYMLPFEISCLICVYFSFLNIPIVYILVLLLIAYQEEKRYLYSFFSIFLLLYAIDVYTLVFCGTTMILGLFSYSGKEDFMSDTNTMEKQHQLYMEHSFYKQLINYSSVFYDLAKYYSDSNELQSQTLSLMGDALAYNAKVSKQYFYQKDEIERRIKQVLKGYKFTLLGISYFENDNKVHIELELQHLYQMELEEVIVPLLDKLTHAKLRVYKKTSYPFQKDKIKVILESQEYLQVETYGNSLHVKEVSGDSFQTFQMHDCVVCMLSDGMGQGSKAKKTSSLLIQIMEAMLRCHIPQMECVKMINYFMRSDVFATLDVLSFDRKANVAYLSKSASAPTFLYRGEQLYEMNAHSLPIGIVDHIQADVFEIKFEKNDIFIMVSDGIQKSEVEKWLSLKRCSNVKNEGLNMMSIISDKKRLDDSTILMAKVS